ncbi:MAG TPA: CDP-alcohol phosphatidyltransferase family protein [Frankiaceae bacterium]|nr:CDP-alcohol phosphatidyltransferase family protein [Frankiaceae bacterium]
MRTVRSGPVRWAAHGLAAQLALVAVLLAAVGAGPLGWLVALACCAAMNVILTRGLTRAGRAGFGPADRVTLLRADLVAVITGLVAGSLHSDRHVFALVGLSVAALLLDTVDGQVARRTGTASRFGARFDMEVDAFLILVLSGYVARHFGGWVLAIGAARYAYVAAGWVLPWLRRQAPARFWCKVVAALQGIVLTVAAAAVLPHWLAVMAIVVALVLLCESFGREAWWLWRHRSRIPETARHTPVVLRQLVTGATRG